MEIAEVESHASIVTLLIVYRAGSIILCTAGCTRCDALLPRHMRDHARSIQAIQIGNFADHPDRILAYSS
jgi:hypothetical protein